MGDLYCVVRVADNATVGVSVIDYQGALLDAAYGDDKAPAIAFGVNGGTKLGSTSVEHLKDDAQQNGYRLLRGALTPLATAFAVVRATDGAVVGRSAQSYAHAKADAENNGHDLGMLHGFDGPLAGESSNFTANGYRLERRGVSR